MLEILCRHTCIFCDESTYRKLDLCVACEQKLPFLKHYCRKCAHPLIPGQIYCGNCLEDLPGAIFTTALFYYDMPIDKMIMKIKFGNNLVGAKILGEIFSDHLEIQYKNQDKPEIIIPVPLHPRRLYERGYNQALELARPLSKKLQMPIKTSLIKRIKFTSPQAQLNAKERIKNVKNSFWVEKDCNFHHVAIVEDVITTGNTVFELCRVLFAAGVKKIDIWCVAKSVLKG